MVQHPNILCILGSLLIDQKIAIISNLVRGSNLQHIIFSQSTKVYCLFWLLFNFIIDIHTAVVCTEEDAICANSSRALIFA